jgi:hypothetical protein
MMSKEDIYRTLETLPPEGLIEVARYIEHLQYKQQRDSETQSAPGLEGLWQGVAFTEDDIAEARREMWGRLGKE